MILNNSNAQQLQLTVTIVSLYQQLTLCHGTIKRGTLFYIHIEFDDHSQSTVIQIYKLTPLLHLSL